MAATFTQLPTVVAERPGFARRAGRAIVHDPLAMFGLVIIAIVAIAALLGPWIAPAPGDGAGVIDVSQRMLPPSR
jgi:ABC-type antimicrobial peptide transport system permease subunit